MPLTRRKGKMFKFVTHTWNPLAGKCIHDCVYCYVESLRKAFSGCKTKYSGKPRIVEHEMINLYRDRAWHDHEYNYIFVCDCTDLFSNDVDDEIILSILDHCREYPENKYLFLTKNPRRVLQFTWALPENSIIGTTIETDIGCISVKLSKAPPTWARYEAISELKRKGFKVMFSVEPATIFTDELMEWIVELEPEFIAIGNDSSSESKMSPPSRQHVECLIWNVEKAGIKVYRKGDYEVKA